MFCKPPLEIDKQIDLLQGRGLIIKDRDKVYTRLSHINYYRLRAYWIPFEINADGKHRFLPNTKWEDIECIYNFDSKLRILLLEAIGSFEISLRTSWAYNLSITYGSQAHEKPEVFFDKLDHADHLLKLKKDYVGSKETFAEHFRNTYPELHVPPIWVACELMTFGELSKWISNLACLSDQRKIFASYGFNEMVMKSFVRHIHVVRNVCAHYGRVWNKRFPFPTKAPKRYQDLFNLIAPSKIYNTIVMLCLLLENIKRNTDWKFKIANLMREYPEINKKSLGFPDNWEMLPLWSISMDQAASAKESSNPV